MLHTYAHIQVQIIHICVSTHMNNAPVCMHTYIQAYSTHADAHTYMHTHVVQGTFVFLVFSEAQGILVRTWRGVQGVGAMKPEPMEARPKSGVPSTVTPTFPKCSPGAGHHRVCRWA